ncbi:MAG TPA: 2-phosphosulfolactate phosphatase [Ignavibacteria bacterium]|jgi:2-phosphosulfolactate phosphatase
MFYEQSEYDIKCEWGIKGIEALAGVSDVFIIVDVLSFSTCVDICVNNGAIVYPYAFRDASAVNFASEIGAELAVSRKDNPDGKKYSLLMSSLLEIPKGTKLVLPSPNGSAISFAAGNKPLICGCLRNSKAVAEYAMKHYKNITVIPAGEKWEDDNTLRPCLEDMLGAGAIISHFKGSRSPESRVMTAAFNLFKEDIPGALKNSSSGKEHKSVFDSFACIIKNSSSGRELIERGYENDIEIASKLNVSSAVPVLVDGGYVNVI